MISVTHSFHTYFLGCLCRRKKYCMSTMALNLMQRFARIFAFSKLFRDFKKKSRASKLFKSFRATKLLRRNLEMFLFVESSWKVRLKLTWRLLQEINRCHRNVLLVSFKHFNDVLRDRNWHQLACTLHIWPCRSLWVAREITLSRSLCLPGSNSCIRVHVNSKDSISVINQWDCFIFFKASSNSTTHPPPTIQSFGQKVPSKKLSVTAWTDLFPCCSYQSFSLFLRRNLFSWNIFSVFFTIKCSIYRDIYSLDI